VYYPASGIDVLRVVAACCPYRLILVDTDENTLGQTEEQLSKIGIKPDKVETYQEDRRDIRFVFNGKNRLVTEIMADARTVNLKELGINQVDVL